MFRNKFCSAAPADICMNTHMPKKRRATLRFMQNTHAQVTNVSQS
uniref:Uncharacterized protein n=1 Tax=Rhizophora mucronata TaxID=61149 RepID=A0A2P2MDB0_RHIMU